MTIKVELADDPDLSGWTELTEVKRETLRCGGIANKTEVGTGSGFDWWDDFGGRDLPGRRPIRVIETATSPDTTLFRGRVSVKNLSRGVIRTEDAKNLGVALDDYNADLRGIIVDGWVRPAETDVARVTALLTTFLSGSSSTSPRARVSTDLADTYVASSPTIALAAETYVDSSPAAVLADIVAQTGKECFVTVDGELFYDAPLSTAYASTYSITDDDPDNVDELPPIWEGDAATEDPTELLSGARAKYGTGSAVVSESRSAIETAFDKWEDTVFLTTNSAANAALQLDTLLDNQGIEEKSRRCSVLVPEDQVDRIKWGQTISFRAAAAGDLTPVTLRISYLLWEVPTSPVAPYIAHLELSKPKKIAPRIKKGTNPGSIPGSAPPWSWGSPDTILEVQTFADRDAASQVVERFTADSTYPAFGDFILGAITFPAAQILTSASTGVDAEESHTRSCFDHVAPAGAVSCRLTTRVGMRATYELDGDVGTLTHWAIYQGTWGAALPTFSAFDPISLASGSLNPADGSAGEWTRELAPVDIEIPIIGGRVQWVIAYDNTMQTQVNAYDYVSLVASIEDRVPGYPLVFTTQSQDQITMQRPDIPMPAMPLMTVDAEGTIYYHLTFYNTTAQPVSGQWVGPENVGSGDGVTTNYFTRFPYASGSLRAYADNLREFDVTETDPATGSFTFGSAPFSVETLTVEYIAITDDA